MLQGACRKCTPVAQVNKPTYLANAGEDGLEKALKTGPVAVAIYGSSFRLQHYKGGVFDDADCNVAGAKINHAVLATGYGDGPQGPYW